MHLLVLSAFRLKKGSMTYGTTIESQCTFWCSVLSDHTSDKSSPYSDWSLNAPFGAQCFPTRIVDALSATLSKRSQCTFWCSVLSDESISVANCNKVKCLNAPFDAQCFPTDRWDYLKVPAGTCLNAPFGAQCFPTAYPSRPIGRRLLLSQCTFWCSVLSDPHRRRAVRNPVQTVSMHLLVLSAFRRIKGLFGISSPSRVSMHLLVLSAFRPSRSPNSALAFSVSMHLLVLSAFRRDVRHVRCRFHRLNAPFGAQCFPTGYWPHGARYPKECLNAPFGAQCFPTRRRKRCGMRLKVSMHLLVLSAFRLEFSVL